MKHFLLVFLTALSISLFAQKTKAVGCGTYTYIQPPENMALQGFSTYYVEPSATADKATIVRKNCKLTGFTKTDNLAEAEFIVRHYVGYLSFTKPEYSKKTTTKEKDGVKTSTTTHSYTGNCSYNISVKIYARKNNELIFSTIWESSNSLSASSIKGSGDAYTQYNNQKESKKKSYVLTGVKGLNTKIDDQLCYLNETFVFKACQVKAKKFNYDEYNGAIETLKTFLNEPNKETKAKELAAAIKLWEAEIPNADLESKKARINKKILAGAYYNIGLAHFAMYNYEEAKKALESAEKYDKVSIYHLPLIKECEKQISRKVNLK